jgi:rare lipoprotein A
MLAQAGMSRYSRAWLVGLDPERDWTTGYGSHNNPHARLIAFQETTDLSRSILATLAVLLFPLSALCQTATHYSHHLSGKWMANGKRYDPNHLIAAHPRHPLGTRLKVTNRNTGKSVIVTVSDHCACSLDLSRAAFERIGQVQTGRIPVDVIRL